MAEPYTFTMAEAAARIRQGSLSPVDLVGSCLRRIDELEPQLKAWVTIDRDAALAEARRCEEERSQGKFRGLLHGIPVGIKDIYYTAGIKTTAGSPLLADFVPQYDATAVACLKQAGAVILGKAVTTEFAALDPAATRNPWNLEHTPGGSSSGSAAAVAARMCPAALGSQTGGSTIRPAAYCGIVGLKPTYGRISCYGVIPVAESLDHVGILTRTVTDAALLLQVLAGHDPQDPNSSQISVPDYSQVLGNLARPPRIGFVQGFFLDRATEEARVHTQATAERLARAGAQVEEVRLPESFAPVPDALMAMVCVEAAAYHEDSFRKQRDQYGPKLCEILDRGLAISGVEYVHTRQVQRQFRRDMTEVLSKM
ncbi:MAG: amidase, partial [Deltaproteobacteria bacterium]|nr:amidase [Deltaproteobacteria bacterium]